MECYKIKDVLKNVDRNSTYNITAPIKQEDRIFKAQLSSDTVNLSSQAASKCKELMFTTNCIANKEYLANKNLINRNTSPTSAELLDRGCKKYQEYRKLASCGI